MGKGVVVAIVIVVLIAILTISGCTQKITNEEKTVKKEIPSFVEGQVVYDVECHQWWCSSHIFPASAPCYLPDNVSQYCTKMFGSEEISYWGFYETEEEAYEKIDKINSECEPIKCGLGTRVYSFAYPPSDNPPYDKMKR